MPYGPSHLVLIGLIVAGAIGFGVVGRRVRDPVRLARGFTAVMVAFLLPMQVWFLLPGQWDLAHSLPLQLCDLAWVVAACALWTRRRWACALTYYWGLTLTPQAMITPALRAPDFPSPQFLDFWGEHLLVVWAAVLLTWGIGVRPDWWGYRVSVAVTACWGLLMLGFNTWAGTDYGFVNRKPDNPSLLDLFGGWPWYLAVEVAVGMAAWALLTWPWTRRHGMAKSC